MSTTINITVGGKGLVEQSRQLAQANRFNKLERDQDAQTQANSNQIKQENDKRKDLRTQHQQPRRFDQEPAANRQGFGVGYLLIGVKDLFTAEERKYISPLNGGMEVALPKPPRYPGVGFTPQERGIRLEATSNGGYIVFPGPQAGGGGSGDGTIVELLLPLNKDACIYVRSQVRAWGAIVYFPVYEILPGGQSYIASLTGGFEEGGRDRYDNCYFVNKSVAKEVPVPSALQSVLETYINPQVGPPVIETKTAGNPPLTWQNNFVFQAPANSSRYPDTLGLFQRYGLLPDVPNASFGYLFSPSIYSVLLNPAATLDEFGSQAEATTARNQYSHVYSRLDTAFRKGKLVSIPFNETSEPSRVYYELPGTPPTSVDTEPLPPNNFAQKRASSLLYPRGFVNELMGAVSMFAWDGNQPAYCRSKLLQLGFRSQDLAP